ncbi:winged helix-turn-helix transcriptional regulator [Paramicrobacterium fandaimingii]|uniref:winged helix-turn-helix transcriptional regulator n=1 Tax=Paramicrobacterium fandaimingii TaxID=2708079 RepID=UPI001FD54DB8|nr:helix-turn-helix domain-containing protein [Microbacterium fandaimingii]
MLDRIGDKWTSMAIKSLAEQAPNELRFSEMQRALVGISAKVLSQTLRNLEHDGLVERRIEATRPPSVYYSLTALGLSLDGPLAAVREWAEANVARIEAAHAQSGSA